MRTEQRIVRVESPFELPDALVDVAGPAGRPVVVSVGGASGMAEADVDAVAGVLRDHAVPIIARWSAAVVDGGTQAGVMEAMGRLRLEREFPLVGVVPAGLAALDGHGVRIDPHHTHVVFVPGQHWGDEAPWLADVASVIARGRPSVTVLMNGGDVSAVDVRQSLQRGRRVLVVAGSGRLADDVAAGVDRPRIDQIRRSPLVTVIRDGKHLEAELEAVLSAP